MPEPDPAAILTHQVLADPTGRRRHRLAIVGRVATMALGLWLVALILGGLGLQPLPGIPIVGDPGAHGAAPPALPKRVQAAVARRGTVTAATGALRAPVITAPHPAGTAPSREQTQAPALSHPRDATTPATTPGQAETAPGRGPASPAPSRVKPSPPTTAPGRTRTPPGQAKTGPGPPDSTPGANRKATSP